MRLWIVILVTCVVSNRAESALLFLENAEDGSSSMTLAPGESKDINIVLEIQDIDTGFAFCVLFFDDDDNESNGVVDITALVPGFDEGGSEMVDYDRSNFELPVDISWDLHSEYGLILSRSDDDNWGPGTYVLDTLTVTHNGDAIESSVHVRFEVDSHPVGARAPGIWTADFYLYPWGKGLAGILPDFADPGVGALNGPFIIDLIDGEADPPSSNAGDVNDDGVIDSLDLGFVQSRFGCPVGTGDPYCDVADVNDDGIVDPLDSGFVLARFGESP